MSKLDKLFISGASIFTLDDMSVLWGQTKRLDTLRSAKQYFKSGKLDRVCRGVYSLPGAKLSHIELANKLVVPSYLSGESILKKHGASFQFANVVTSVALVSRRVTVDGTIYRYSKMNARAFYNTVGIENGEASLERAVADLTYITGGRFVFEDLSDINWDKLSEIAKIYDKRSVTRYIAALKEKYHA